MTKAATSRADLPALLQRALELAIDAKAVGPVVLHLTEVAGYTDHALIVSGRSDRHVGGISEAIMTGLKAQGVSPIGSDGLEEHLWDLLDYDDFLVHVFYHPVRKHYDLESMWNDAPRVELGLPADVMDTSGLDELAPPDPMPAFRGGSFGAFEGELDGDDPDLADAPGELPAVVDDGTNELADDGSNELADDDDDYTDEDLDDYEDDADDLADDGDDDDALAELDGDDDDDDAPVDATVAAEPARPARRK